MGTADYFSLPLRQFIDDLAARSATPGGGSVAALAGSLGAGLGSMVLEFTIGKEKYARHEAALRPLLVELRRAREEFDRLLAEDMRAYEGVLAARKLDAAAREQAAARASAVPMEVVALAGGMVARFDAVKAMVNTNLIGDLRGAAILGHAAARAAACTVRDNLGSFPDRREAERLEDRLDVLLARAKRHCDAVVHFQVAG